MLYNFKGININIADDAAKQFLAAMDGIDTIHDKLIQMYLAGHEYYRTYKDTMTVAKQLDKEHKLDEYISECLLQESNY